MDNLKNIVSQNIIFLRTQHKMTQFELGEKLNYSDKTISKWERAEAIPDAYILKQMSELFNVSIDYILSEHNKEKEKHPLLKNNNHITITKISIVGLWSLAALLFIVLWILGNVQWLIIVYTIPISFIVLLVFNSIWGKRRNNFYIISALILSILAAIYLSLLNRNIWQIFLLEIPSEIIIYLCFKLNESPNKLN